MDEILLDTSAWIEVASGRRPMPARYSGAAIVVCTLALAELASVAERGRAPKDSVARMLVVARLEACTVADAVEGGLLHGRQRMAGNGKVSMIDCITYCVARRVGLPYVTADRDLKAQTGVVLL